MERIIGKTPKVMGLNNGYTRKEWVNENTPAAEKEIREDHNTTHVKKSFVKLENIQESRAHQANQGETSRETNQPSHNEENGIECKRAKRKRISCDSLGEKMERSMIHFTQTMKEIEQGRIELERARMEQESKRIDKILEVQVQIAHLFAAGNTKNNSTVINIMSTTRSINAHIPKYFFGITYSLQQDTIKMVPVDVAHWCLDKSPFQQPCSSHPMEQKQLKSYNHIVTDRNKDGEHIGKNWHAGMERIKNAINLRYTWRAERDFHAEMERWRVSRMQQICVFNALWSALLALTSPDTILHVRRPTAILFAPRDPEEPQRRLDAKACETANSIKAMYKLHRPEVRVEILVMQGDAGPIIVNQAKQQDISLLLLGQPKPSLLQRKKYFRPALALAQVWVLYLPLAVLDR
eukprot:Gb_06636 [translate_table: standard]